MLTGRYRAGRRLRAWRAQAAVQGPMVLVVLVALALPGLAYATSTSAASEAALGPSDHAVEGSPGDPDHRASSGNVRWRAIVAAAPASGTARTLGQVEDGTNTASEPYALPVPPAGGVTIGYAGTTSLERLLEVQRFSVRSVTVLDVRRQQTRTYVPGAPEFASTLRDDHVEPDSVVFLRRTGTFEGSVGASGGTSATDDEPAAGSPWPLPAPPPGGLTLGMAGTSDIEALVEAQRFPVTTVLALHVPTQQWLFHVVGAPPNANTLTAAALEPDMFIAIRRAEPPVAAVAGVATPDDQQTPPADADSSGGAERSGGVARITYYYCERGSNSATWGDGGGFCGAMRSGTTVYAGAAACAASDLGQRFRIVGDPMGRTYTCEDTGSAVRGNHRDIWFRNSDEAARWYAQVGTHAEVIIVE